MRRGAALVESALLFPLLLLMTLGAMQLALLTQARLVVQGAAVAAARAAIADPYGRRLSPKRAASVACASIAGPTLPAGIRPPAWENAPGPRGVKRLILRGPAATMKTRSDVTLAADEAVAEVGHDCELMIPGVSRLFVWLDPANRTLTRYYGSPHVLIAAKAVLPAPWLGPKGVRPGRWPSPAPRRRR